MKKVLSRSPHGERGLKFRDNSEGYQRSSRSPHGERGLKSHAQQRVRLIIPSRSPHGERGLKCAISSTHVSYLRRSPHGERGLKSASAVEPEPSHAVALLMESVD